MRLLRSYNDFFIALPRRPRVEVQESDFASPPLQRAYNKLVRLRGSPFGSDGIEVPPNHAGSVCLPEHLLDSILAIYIGKKRHNGY